MQMSGNTVLLTGGGTGIGFELARSLVARGNEVIICGRRIDRLEAARSIEPKLHIRAADVSDPTSRGELLAWLLKSFPALNVLVNNAGVQNRIDFRKGAGELRKVDEEIATNLMAPIHLTALLLPELLRQPAAAVVNISSGLGFTPLAPMPVYCATKAALHSWTMSLRHQLRETPVRVFEMIPPTVTSELGAGHRPPEVNRAAMPAAEAAAGMVEALEQDRFEAALGEAVRLREKGDALFPVLNRM